MYLHVALRIPIVNRVCYMSGEFSLGGLLNIVFSVEDPIGAIVRIVFVTGARSAEHADHRLTEESGGGGVYDVTCRMYCDNVND